MEQNWVDVTLRVGLKDAEEAAWLIGESSPYGIYIEDYSRLEEETLEIAHIDLIDEALLGKDREHVWIHVYVAERDNPPESIAYIEEKLKNAGVDYVCSLSSLKEEDWANNWKQYFHPIHIGKNLLICPSWETAPNPENRAVLYLEPGMAFGTGTHATTCLCMEVMEPFINEKTCLLDVGCGSGILALSALLLGAQKAVGVDIDEKAVKTAKENAARNGMAEPKITFKQGDLCEQISGTYNLIVANIVADVIVLLCKDIAKFLCEGGVFIVSGIICESEAQVQKAFNESGLHVCERHEKAGWLSFVLKQKKAAEE